MAPCDPHERAHPCDRKKLLSTCPSSTLDLPAQAGFVILENSAYFGRAATQPIRVYRGRAFISRAKPSGLSVRAQSEAKNSSLLATRQELTFAGLTVSLTRQSTRSPAAASKLCNAAGKT